MTFLTKIKQLGPGLLYAGAAVGVSHLVQSTRAGALYGYGLLWAVLLANVLKYPFFKFAPYYASITKKNLVQGYAEIGKWSVWLFAATTISSMFIVQAAVTVVTSGLINEVFGLNLTPFQGAAGLLFVCLMILFVGKYNLLDQTMKIIITLLSITTIIAVFLSFKNTSPVFEYQFSFSNIKDVAFLIALMGWMPAPFDVSVWHSVWTIEKQAVSKQEISLKNSLSDFNIGYWGTMILAVFFVILGANTLFGKEIELASSATGFAGQLIGIYTQTIGDWAYILIAVAALTTMFSTTLTCFDAYPRVMVPATNIVLNKETSQQTTYWFWIIILYAGTVFLIGNFMQNMKEFIDFVTKVSFLTAPIIAGLNFWVVFSKLDKSHRPSNFMKWLSVAGLLYLIGFSVYYLML